ncbi:uncharacterized protein TM35_000041650 [Trypanosoma theileri]|uniref:PSP1 C-terminal domain-containing protein n=1 Tax=Trypanosoma theileri TaxID=67003 RepID=A0A1X0P536_9TRYP|nr:uncharacterized protein TM35_000041650 [Trypanosoma theileri]ORC91951.1 hypothetical protein TM35_000041650 [Trypanosoma theileri]
MLPTTTMTAPRVSHGAKTIRRYRHDPYGARVLEPLPAVVAAAPSLPHSASHSSSSSASTPSSAPEGLPAREILPTVGGAGATVVYTGVVAFKYGGREFTTTARVQVGDAIVVDGDRGEDLGFVQRVTAQTINSNNNNNLPYAGERVRRIATAEDLQQHHARAQKEEEALCTMRVLAKQVKCPAFIQDIMYQLDSRKITVIIARESRSYVDFRRLQRAAFDVFRCRVWCEYLDEIAMPQLSGSCDAAVSSAFQLPLQRPLYGRRSRCPVLMPDTRDMIAQA